MDPEWHTTKLVRVKLHNFALAGQPKAPNETLNLRAQIPVIKDMKYQLAPDHVFTGHNAAVYHLSPGSTPDRFLSAGGEGWITEWPWSGGDGRLVARTEAPVVSLVWLRRGERIAAGTLDGKLHFIETASQERTRVFDLGGKAAVFSLLYNGSELWAGDGIGRVTRWSPEGELLQTIEVTRTAVRSLIAAPSGDIYAGCSDAHIHVLDAETGTVRRSWIAHDPSVFAMAFDPQDASLWTGGRDALLKHWQVIEGIPVCAAEIPAHWFTVNAIAFHPAERIFASASRDKRLRLWDAGGNLLQSIDPMTSGGHVNSVNALMWSDDGQRLLSTGDDRSIRSWILNMNN